MELAKVHKINQKYKDIVFRYIDEAQTLFPKDNAHFIIADLIKHLCLLYYYSVFQSSILTDKEQQEFLNLLSQNNKNLELYEWNLIYSSSGDKLNKDSVINQVYDKPNILCIIHTENDNICGGFTKTGWGKNHKYQTKDAEAFLFSIRSSMNYPPIIANVDKNGVDRALRYGSFLCRFGNNLGLKHQSVRAGNGYIYQALPNRFQLLGGNATERVKNVEIFQLKCV